MLNNHQQKFIVYHIQNILSTTPKKDFLLELNELTFRPTNHSIRKGGTGENRNDVTPLNFITGSILYAIFSNVWEIFS